MEVGSFPYTLAFSRQTSVLSRCRILAWLVFLGEVARPGLVSMPGLDTVILVLPFPSWAISPFRRWCRSSLLALLGTDLVLFLALRPRLASLSVAVLTYCLLVGMVASLVEAFFRGCSSVDCVVRVFLPVGLRLVYRLARSPRLLLLELFPSFKFRVAALAGLLFSSSCTCLVSSGIAASRMFGCGLALSGLSGCSPLGVLPPRFPLGCLLPLWVASAAAWGLASHFSLAFSFGVVVAPWFLVGVLQRFSPPGGFLLQFS